MAEELKTNQSPMPGMTPTSIEGEIQPTIDFYEALKEVLSGKKITKLEWKNKEYYGFLDGDILKLHKPDGKSYGWTLNNGDLSGTDYIVIDSDK